jgi:cardiolipin synthase
LVVGNKVTLLVDGPATYDVMFKAIQNAKDHINLETYIFEDDEVGRRFAGLLLKKQSEGIRINIILSGVSDATPIFYAERSHYTHLLKSGVSLYEHRDAMLHAKTVVIDGVWSTLGSTNMDLWSFLRNDEVNAIILGQDFGDEMEAMFAKDLESSNQIQLEQWKKRPFKERLKEPLSRLFQYWL